jgi:hypothetical protein
MGGIADPTTRYPRHVTSKVTRHVVDRARATILRNAAGDTYEAKVRDARELMDMLGLTNPKNLLKSVVVGDSSRMGDNHS